MSDSADSHQPAFSSSDEQGFSAAIAPAPARSSRIWLLLLVFAGLVAAYLVWGPRGEDRTRGQFHPAVGTPLPWRSLQPLLNAESPVDAEDVDGQVTLVNFWGPWCPPCREEFPKLMTLRETFAKEPRFRLLSVTCSASPEEPEASLREDTRAYLQWLKQEPPIHVDRNAAFRRHLFMTAKMEDFAYPTSVLLDSGGVIRGIWVGYYEGEEKKIRDLITDLLKSSDSTQETSP